MKKIINAHIETGNIITSDGWAAYSWLDLPFSGYVHSVHNHGKGDFDNGLDSTSHIETLWSHLKTIIRKIYYIFPHEHFVLFFKKAEFRRNINSLDNDTKLDEICGIIKYIQNIGIDELYSEEYLIKII